MSAAPLTWMPDDDTLFLWESNISTVLLDSSKYQMTFQTFGSPSVVPGITGNGRAFPDTTSWYRNDSTGWTAALTATAKVTIDAMIHIADLTSTPHAMGVFMQNFAGSDNGFYFYLDADGTCEMRFRANNGTAYDMTGVTIPGIPGTDYVHIRGTCDWDAQQINLLAGVPGQPLTLISTLTPPAGLNFYNATTVFDQVFFGNKCAGLDKVRVSRVIRTDTFPTQSTAPTATSATSTSNVVTINLNQNILLQNNSSIASNWLITSSTGHNVTVNSVTTGLNTIILNTTNQTIGASYTISIPSGIIGAVSGLNYTTPSTINFTGAGSAPTITYDKVIDAFNIEIGYSEQMDLYLASKSSNYTINNGLSVIQVTPINNQVFVLTTSRQVTGTVYTITVNAGAGGVASLYGNKVT